MTATLAFVGLVYLLSLVALIGALWRAPQGFEDEHGFHRGAEPRD